MWFLHHLQWMVSLNILTECKVSRKPNWVIARFHGLSQISTQVICLLKATSHWVLLSSWAFDTASRWHSSSSLCISSATISFPCLWLWFAKPCVSWSYRAHHLQIFEIVGGYRTSTLAFPSYLWLVLVCGIRSSMRYAFFCKYLRELKYVLSQTGLYPKSGMASQTISGFTRWIGVLLLSPNWRIVAASCGGTVNASQITRVSANFCFVFCF